MTTAQLRQAETRYRRAFGGAEKEREARNAAVRQALAEGWTHQKISEATGLSRGRISQLKEFA